MDEGRERQDRPGKSVVRRAVSRRNHQSLPQRRVCHAGQKPSDDYYNRFCSVCFLGLHVPLWASVDLVKELRRTSCKDTLGQSPFSMAAMARLAPAPLSYFDETGETGRLPEDGFLVSSRRGKHPGCYRARWNVLRRYCGRGGKAAPLRGNHYSMCVDD